MPCTKMSTNIIGDEEMTTMDMFKIIYFISVIQSGRLKLIVYTVPNFVFCLKPNKHL